MRKILFILFLLPLFSYGQSVYDPKDSTQTEALIRALDTINHFTHDVNRQFVACLINLNHIARSSSGGGGFSNPMNTLGDIIYEDASPAAVRLAGNTTSTKKFLSQTGNGSISAVPAWSGLAVGDMPYTFASGVTLTTATVTNDLITGKSGGQTIIGGTGSGENLTINSTSNATKGSVNIGSSSKFQFDEANTKLNINGAQNSGTLNVKPSNGAIGIFVKNTTDADKALLINSSAANQTFFQGDGNSGIAIAGGQLAVGVAPGTFSGPKLMVSGNASFPSGAIFKGNTDANIGFAVNNAAGTTNEHLFFSNGNANINAQNAGFVMVGSASTATSTFQIAGTFAETYTSTATGITLGTHIVVEVTATGQTITLPTAVGISGREYEIKLTASGSCTVNTTASQTIDASTTYSLSAQYKYVRVQSNGANWIIIANN